MDAADHEIDARDLLCPLPVLKARKCLAGMQTGAVLSIVTTDPMAVIDLPHFCANSGHLYLHAKAQGGETVHMIRCAGQNPAD